ncbi:hypothetical protein [uncultured Algoriphagus sp.]|uniref:hypothetical protein n=1 Tax=uncultured Algoriphagus sp. TaxID=417365 RepID=UPI0030EDB72D|tara:strand:- start:377 stop:607 length:231 start_codon:yes stop_codon:yes gene_type:complete
MSGAELLLSLAGVVTMMLLSIIAYFLKLLIQDTRQLRDELAKLKELFYRLEAEQALIKEVMQPARNPPAYKTARRT